ncbi:MAG: hypothetical protein ACTSSE_08605 [Candidatus Thorarchaeota archaeon]
MDIKDVKVGMTVRMINEKDNNGNDYHGLKYGNVGVVCGIYSLNNHVLLCGYGSWSFDLSSLELAYSLEIGCKVRVVDSRYKEYNGTEGIVTDISASGYCIIISHTGSRYQFNKSELIVLDPAPKKEMKLEVGCRVRVINNGYLHLNEGIVKKYSPGCMVDVLFDNRTYKVNVSKRHLQVIEPAPRGGVVKGTIFDMEYYGDFHISKEALEKFKIDIKDGGLYANKFQTWSKQMDDVARMFSYEDIEKCMADIEQSDLDKYGKWALDYFKSSYSISMLGEPIVGFDWAIGGNKMEIDHKEARELAKKTDDEFVGFDTKTGTVMMKNAGEVMIRERDISIMLTDDDIDRLMHSKGLKESLGKFQIGRYSDNLTVKISYIEPVNEIKEEQPEAD